MIQDATHQPPPRVMKVLVAVERPLTRSALRSLLDSEPGVEAVEEAADLLGALQTIRAARPDVVLVDRATLGDAGLDRLPMLAAPGVAVFLVGMGDHPRLEAYARRAGAAGYIRLDEAPERLSSALASLASPPAA